MSEQEITTLQLILKTAKKEFLEKGYSDTSLREIAKKAGVTTGAFYGYFKSKEELFTSLVGEKYDHVLNIYKEILLSFQELPQEEQQKNMLEYTKEGAIRIIDYAYDNFDEFKLILCHSEGTPYNDLVHEMAEMDVDATHDFMEGAENAGEKINKVNPLLEHMLISGMFSAFFELIVHDVPRSEADDYIKTLIVFYSAGWMKIMGI